MNLFAKQTRKSAAKRFVLLFLTLLALGFKANAQIPTFSEILKQYYNTDNLILKSSSRTTPYGQQLQNYGFEEWEQQSKKVLWNTKTFYEPYNWNSFMTADGNSILTAAVSDQLNESSEKRPGSTGVKSARIFSKSTAGVIANGNITTGRIYAGSATASDDKNYNYTKRSDAKFNTPLTTVPDSLTVWVAFKSKTDGTMAKVNTTIHGDTDLKQLATSGDSPADMVCATANMEFANTSTSEVVWRRLTIPFVQGTHSDPRYILTTITTNVIPGGGSEGDEMFIDDICLIYNPSLEMDYLAQTEFDGSNMNIEVPFTLDGSMSVYNLNAAANEVIAQLSDVNGSFANPIELGRITTDVSGTINGVIPADLAEGTYKVRVVSTNYQMESNEADITIKYHYVAVPQVEIVRGNFTAKSIEATFTPNADCAQYYFLIAPATETIDAAYIKTNGEVQTESYTKLWEGLTSNTEYAIYALPVDADGINGEVKAITVTTKALVPQVEITKGDVTTKSVTASFAPNADCVQYYILIAPATETIDAEYIKANGENQTVSYTKSWENLISNTDYVVYALPVDVEGNNGEIATLTLKTQAFAPQIDIARDSFTAKTITATFTPNSDCVEYYFMIVPATETIDAEYIKANGEKQTASYTTTFEGLTSNTEYAIYALPIDVDGFNGEIKTITVTTKALVPQVEITKGDLLTYSISASFAPNADCAQYYFLISAETVDAEYIKENGELKSESYAHTWENLMPNTNYTIYVLPIDIENNEGAVNTLVVKTRVEAGVSEIDFDIEKLNETTVTITATPNENTVLYHYIVITKAEADAMGEEALMQKLNENENYLDSVAYEFTMTVESNVEYYFVAQGKNRDDKWGEVAKAEFVVAGPAAVAVAVEKLNETSVSITATPNENAVSYKYIVIEKAEADAMETEALMQKLAEANELTAVDVWTYSVKSNVEYYVIAQGKNADGMFGEMTQVEFKVAGSATVAIAVEELSETSVEITATPNENAVAYHYIVITKAEADSIGEDALIQRLNENENYIEGASTEEMTIESNVAYYVVAQAKNADDMFGVITKVEFMVEVAGPAVVAIEVKEVSETSVEVTATPNENTVSYKYIVIEKAEADSIGEAALMQRLAEANELTAVDVWTYSVKSNVEYNVIAQGKNADDKFGELTIVEFMVEYTDTTAVAEFDEAMFEIYPNPASEYVRITSDVEIESLMIFSMDGKMVYSQDVNQEETMIDVTGFAKGSYIVRMVSNDRFVVRRIIVR